MRTIADTAVGSIVGLVVLAAMFTVIWIARDYSTGASTVPAPAPAPAPVAAEAQTQALQSSRSRRAPMMYTPIPSAQLRELQEKKHR
jgi:hypothetical protein